MKHPLRIPEEQFVLVCELFFSEAGRCLHGLPANVNRTLWHQWRDGFKAIGDKGMWISAVFEVAWHSALGTTLSAERFAWSGTTNRPLGAMPQQQQPGAIGASDVSGQSAHWYSVIDDLVPASIAVVDILLEADEDDL